MKVGHLMAAVEILNQLVVVQFHARPLLHHLTSILQLEQLIALQMLLVVIIQVQQNQVQLLEHQINIIHLSLEQLKRVIQLAVFQMHQPNILMLLLM